MVLRVYAEVIGWRCSNRREYDHYDDNSRCKPTACATVAIADSTMGLLEGGMPMLGVLELVRSTW